MLLEDQLCQARLLGIIFQQRRVPPVIIVRISRVVLWHVYVGTECRRQYSFDPFTTKHYKKLGVQTPMLLPLCTRQKPSINFTADWVDLRAGLGVRNMSLPSGSDHLAHSDSLY